MAMVETDSSEGQVGQTEEQDVQRGWTRRLLRWAPLLVIAGGLAAALIAGVDSESLLTLLEQNHAELGQWVSDNLVLAIAVYAAIYAVSIALSVPGGAVLTLAGGFLFGAWAGTAIVVAAATVGATGLFLAARAAVGENLTRKAGPFVERMEAGFRRDAFAYLLFLRLTPIFPFWIVNLAPALLHVRLRTFVLATVLGIIPGTFVFASFGAGIGQLLAAGADITVGDVLSLEVILGLTGLALLALVPIALRAWRRRGSDDGAD